MAQLHIYYISHSLYISYYNFQAHGYGAVYNDEGDHTPNGYGVNTGAYGYAPAVYSNNAVSRGHDYVKELKSGIHYVDSRGAGESNDHGFYSSNVVSADAYGQSAYSPAVYAKAPAGYANAPFMHAIDARPVVYAADKHVAQNVVYAQDSGAHYANSVDSYSHGDDNSYLKASDNSYAHGYGLGHGSYDGRYRFSGMYSPVTAGHYFGYGNKYNFRQNYPYGYGEMLSYTAPVGQ